MELRETILIMMVLFLVLPIFPLTHAQYPPEEEARTNYKQNSDRKQPTINDVNLTNMTSNLTLLHCNVYCNGTSKEHIVKGDDNCPVKPECKQCHCDDLCQKYGDCCPDIEGHLNSNQNTITECVGETGSKIDKNGYFMMTSCPGSSSIYWAENGLVSPVTSLETKLTYVNLDIAACNNATSLLLRWSKTKYCSQIIPRTSSKGNQHARCVAQFKPTFDFTARQCNPLFWNRKVIDSCNPAEMRGNSTFDIDVNSNCTEGPTYVVSEGDNVFKNIYCFLCNGFYIPSCEMSLDPRDSNSINDLVDLNEISKPVCTSDQWYDSIKNVCRDLQCRVGHELQKQDCISNEINLTNVEFSFRRTFWSLGSSNPRPDSWNEMESLIIQNLPGIMAEIDVYDFVFTIDNTAKFFLDTDVRMTDNEYRLGISDSVPEFRLNIEFRTNRSCCRQDYEEMISGYLSSNWTLAANGSINEYQTREDDSRLLVQDISSYKVLSPSEIPVKVRPDTSLTHILGKPGLYLFVPIIEPTCAFVYLSHREFKWNNGESITLKYADIMVPLKNITKHGEKLIVCRGVLEDLYEHYHPNDILQKAKNIISQFCSILSLICLTFTFITYCTFPSLLTLPTKNTMCLVVSLFIAQGLFQFQALALRDITACKVIGVLLHYFWLCVIFWMNVCSYHMFNVFVLETTKPITSGGYNKRLLCYFLYANGTPAVIVLATITASLIVSSGSQIGYGDGPCYLSSALLVGVSFVLPLGIILVLNVIFFGMTVWTMAKISKMSDTIGKDRNQVHIYIKLSTLTGVFWIFSLIGQNSNLEVLNFISIVLNASQGVFVFISYVTNRRILNMWRRHFVKEEPGMKSSVSIISSKPGKTVTQLQGMHMQ